MLRFVRKISAFARDVLLTLARFAIAFVKYAGLTTALTILASCVLGFALYEAGTFHYLVRFAIEKYMGRYTRTECRVGRVEGNLLTGMDIYGFAVGNGPSLARDGAALVIDEIHVRYNPGRFVRREAVVDRVHVVRPRLVLKRDADRRINLARIFGPKGPRRGKGVYFEVTEVVMDDAYFKMFLNSPLSEFSRAHIECTFTKARGAVFIDLRHCSCYLPEFGQKVPHFGSGLLAINARRMHFTHVDAASATTTLTTGGTIKFKPRVYLDLRFRGDPLDIGEVGQGVFDDPPEFFGRGRYEGTLVGPVKDLHQAGTLVVETGYLYSYRLRDVMTYYDFDIPRRQVRINGFEGRVNGMPAFVAMTVDFRGSKPAYWGDARLLSVNLADYVGNEFLTTNVDCRLRFTGTGLAASDYALAVNAAFGAGRLGPVTVDGGAADFRYAAGRADITNMVLRAGGGELAMKGRGDRESVALDMNARRIPFRRLAFKGALGRTDGFISFDGRVEGPHKKPSFRGSLVMNELGYGSLRADTARLEGYWNDYGGDDRADVHVMAWDMKWGPLILPRGYGDLAVTNDLYILTNGYLETPDGSNASFDVGYDAARGRAELGKLDLKLKRGEARLSEPLVLAREGSRVTLSGGPLRYAGGELVVSGSYAPAGGALAGVAEARRIPLDDLIPPSLGVALTGTLNRLRLDVTGTAHAPVLYANLAASNLSLNGQPVDFVHGEASYENHRVIIPGITAGLAGGTLRATAYLPLAAFGGSGTEPLDATVWFSKFKLSAFNAFYARGIFDEGYIEGVVTATGTARAPTVRGNLLLTDVRRGELYFAKGRADFTYQDGLLDIREVSLTQRTLPNLIVRGRVPFGWDKNETAAGDMDLKADLIDLDLRVVSLFTDDVLVTAGKARGAVALTGSYARPQLEGRVTVVGGAGTIPALRSSFADLQGEVAAGGGDVTVAAENPLAFQADDGQGQAWGNVKMDGLKPVALDLNIGLKNYVVRAISGVQARGNVNLTLAGPRDHLQARAEAELTSGLISLDFGGEGPAYAAAKGAGLDYDVHVVAPGNLWLRNGSADIEFEADVRIRRVGGENFYLGDLKARRGYYYFLQRDFTIEHAEISLTGSAEINPVLNLQGRRIIRALSPEGSDAAITIDVTGTMREPVVTLAYEAVPRAGALATQPPPQSQDEILMLLALDLTYEDYLQLSAAGGELASKESADYVRRYAEAEVARAVRRQTGLEVFQFESTVLTENLTGPTEESYTEVTVGQHLTPGLYVSYTAKYREDPSTGAAATEHAGEVDYELKRNLYLVGSTYEDEGMQRYGLGVRFMRKY